MAEDRAALDETKTRRRRAARSRQKRGVRNEALEIGESIDGSIRFLDGMLINPGIREWLEDADVDWREGFRTMVDERLEATRDGSAANRYD